MFLEKLIIKQEETYKLEVNDKGEYIEFDLTDISLPEKIMIASENIAKLDKEYREKILKIDVDFKNDEIEKAKQSIKLEKEQCLKMRKEFDSFLGDGACYKIFGDTNRYGMFINLFEGLEEHFQKMKINIAKAKEKLVNKYLPKRNDVM